MSNSDHQRTGVITQWNDERGFGFITPADGGARAFVHVSSFPRERRPANGVSVAYVERRDDRNRINATRVRILSDHFGRSKGPAGVGPAAAFLVGVAGLALVDLVPPVLVGVYLALSLATFLMYRSDKAAALAGGWRTQESTLHLAALLGGWPGALVARPMFRHKTTKEPFRTIFWVTVVLNCALLGFIALDLVPAISLL
jgi:uncharacterized membrane protein YsdA (DUF1294 family)/cold shock CspA family protein